MTSSSLISKVGKKVYIVDDEPDISELVAVNLEKSGFSALQFEKGETFFQKLVEEIPDLIILDIMLPDSDGFEICKQLKSNEQYSHIPIIMLSAKGAELEKVLGLEIGADDYVTKPFSPRELVARVKAILRRENQETKTKQIKIGNNVVINLLTYEVFLDNKRIELTSSEYRILCYLAEKKGWVFSREQILDHLGVQEKGVLDRTVDVHIKNLREKLKSSGRYIRNIRGVGYKIEV